MKSSSYSQPRHSQTHMRRIWTFFAIFMLLASLIPAMANPVAAQSDGDQAQDPITTEQTEQTGDQPPDGQLPPDEGQPPDGELPPDGGEAPEGEVDDQSLQEQGDQPPVLVEAGSVVVNYRLCPPTADLTAPDPTALSTACTVTGEGATFGLSGASGDPGSQGTGAAPGTATFSDVPSGTVSLTQLTPSPAGPLAAFCEGNTSQGNTKPYSQAFLAGATITFEVLPGEQVSCDWYAAQPVTGGTVTVYKWNCAAGTESGRELEYYQGGLPDQETGPCESEHLNISMSLVDATGPRDKLTQANSTQWIDVVPNTAGQVRIIEQIPSGYGDPIVYCGTLDQDTQSLTPSPGGTVTLQPPAGTTFDYQCNWYNIPQGAGTVTIYKWECP